MQRDHYLRVEKIQPVMSINEPAKFPFLYIKAKEHQ
jgi:hypothetical protein